MFLGAARASTVFGCLDPAPDWAAPGARPGQRLPEGAGAAAAWGWCWHGRVCGGTAGVRGHHRCAGALWVYQHTMVVPSHCGCTISCGTKGPCGALLGGCLTASCSPSAGVMSLLRCADLKLFAGGLDATSVFLSLSHIISAANEDQDKECLGCRSRGSAKGRPVTQQCSPVFSCFSCFPLGSAGLRNRAAQLSTWMWWAVFARELIESGQEA